MIDNYTRRLNSLVENIVNSREEEGNQSMITLNAFYGRYKNEIDKFNTDFNFEAISLKYAPQRSDLLTIAKSLNNYLDFRRSAVENLSEVFSSYKSYYENESDYNEYLNEMRTSYYSRDFYYSMALESLSDKTENALNFIDNKYSYLSNLTNMDSIFIQIDSISSLYNLNIEDNKLEERIILPVAFCDTVHDWMVTNKELIIKTDLE